MSHVFRFENTRHIKLAISWTPEGRRKRGRPKETWRRIIERERQDLGFQSWTDSNTVARDRQRLRGLVSGPILLKGKWK